MVLLRSSRPSTCGLVAALMMFTAGGSLSTSADAQVVTAQAPTYSTMPLLSESEAGGVGCAVAMVAAGAVTVQIMGGPAAVAALLSGPVLPLYVLEAGAASAFLLSSACYIGQAMTPLGSLAINSIGEFVQPKAIEAQ